MSAADSPGQTSSVHLTEEQLKVVFFALCSLFLKLLRIASQMALLVKNPAVQET